jgi:3',5'-cyclic AMP phosphodiesterase CpdA
VRVLAHLSDLHFGRVDRATLEPLHRRLAELAPHLVVVSGDLTQRARARQFRQARAFLDTLPRPQCVVPGNHDVPLFNLIARFFRPLAGYRRYIAKDTEPSFVDEEIAVLGINTARSFTWKSGRVSEAQLARVQAKLCRLDGGVTKVIVTHHPFMAPERLAECGVDLLLAGHLHASQAAATPDRVLMVQAGTATSRRTRKEPNAFNLLRVSRGRIEVEQHVLRGGAFVRGSAQAFRRNGAGWTLDGPA